MGATLRSVNVKAESGVWDRPSEPPADRYQSAGGSVCNVIRMQRPANGPRVFVVNAIQGPSRRFDLRKALMVSVTYDEGVSISHSTLPVHGYGDTWDEALADFSEMFEVQYEGLVECEVSQLTPAAAQARRELQSLV